VGNFYTSPVRTRAGKTVTSFEKLAANWPNRAFTVKSQIGKEALEC